MANIWAFSVFRVSINLSRATSQPRSITSHTVPASIIATIFIFTGMLKEGQDVLHGYIRLDAITRGEDKPTSFAHPFQQIFDDPFGVGNSPAR